MTQELSNNETLMTHFIMKAPPPSVPYDVAARGMSEGLSIRALKPDYDLILSELERIGDGWHLRDEHTSASRKEKTKKILEGSNTSIWHFMRGNEAIGFCVAVKKGFGSEHVRVSERFGLEAKKGAEIYKVGLYRPFIGSGYGHNFLPAVQAALLSGQEGVEQEGIKPITPNEFIYLNTRKTNLVDSTTFYKTLGYQWAGEERWPISTTEIRGIQEASKALPSQKVVRPLVPGATFLSGPRLATG